MKVGSLAVATAMVIGVSAGKRNAARHHAHANLHERGVYPTAAVYPTAPAAEEPQESCGCTTIYTFFTGEGTLYNPPVPTVYVANTTSTTAAIPTTTVYPTPLVSTHVVPSPVVPTPLATICPTPGVYTIPATTVTLTNTTTVCGATSTYVPVGTHTAGGVTTVVKNATTVVCPYAAIKTNEGVVTSTILTTTYVCPAAGTYTIAPLTTTVTKPVNWVYPTPATYVPGIYTQPEIVTTITETDYVVICPYTSPAPAPTSAYVAPPVVKPVHSTAPAVETSVAPLVVKPAPSKVPVVESYVAPSAAPSTTSVVESYKPATSAPAKPSSSPSSPSNQGELGSSGNKWAMTYTPYSDDGQCKDAGAVLSDIAIIAKAGFTAVRVYGSDCSGLENIGAACETHGLKMILGLFISSTGIAGAKEQLSTIVSWGKWDLVEVFVIGNEALMNNYCTGPELAAFILSCKTAMAAGGYNGLVTTTETLDQWQKHADVLCPVVDVVGCNIHPFFNAEVDAESAGDFVASQLKIVDQLCPGKYGVNLETGWPSSGTCNGKACPGSAEQATAIKKISAAAGGKSVMFSYGNDYWKKPGPYDCEQSWGSIQYFQ